MQLFFCFLQIFSEKENSSWNSLPSRSILSVSRRGAAIAQGSRDPSKNTVTPF